MMKTNLLRSLVAGALLALGLPSGASAQCSGQFQPGRFCGNAGGALGLPGPVLLTPSVFQPIAGGTVIGNRTGANAVPAATSIPVLGIPGSVQGSIGLAGASSGTITIVGQAAAGTYNFNLPTAAGTAGQAMLSGGGGAAPMTFGTLQVPAGGTGLTGGTSGGVPYFDSASTMASSGVLAVNRIMLGGGAGAAPGVMASAGSAGQILQSTGATAPAFSTATYPSTTTINQLLYSSSNNVVAGLATVNGGLLNAGATGVPAMTVSPVLGVPGASTGSLGFAGLTSGTVTVTPQAVAGTATLTLPNTSGTFAVGASSPLVLSATTGGLTCPTCVTSSGGGAITGSAPIAVSGAGVVSLNTNGVTYAYLQQVPALSLVGNGTNATANAQSLTGTANQIARVNGAGTAMGFGSIDLSQSAAVGTSLLPLANGGANAALTASNGGIVWSNATQLQILAGTATARLPLLSGAAATPVWGAFTLPATVTSGGIPYFSSASVMASSGALTLNGIVLGGGAGGSPTALASLGTTTTVLHGNAAGAPTFGAVVNADMATMLDGTVKANVSGSTTTPSDVSISGVLDKQLGSTRGTIPYRGASGWTGATPGTAGFVWTSNGAGADPTWQAAAGGRTKLTGNTSYYVATTGSDSNDCVTVGTPCLTLQGAYNKIVQLDFNAFTVTVNVANGTYAPASAVLDIIAPQVGGGVLQYIGNTSTPGSVILNSSGDNTIKVSNNAVLLMNGFEFRSSTAYAVRVAGGASFTFGPNVNFGAASAGHLFANSSGRIVANAGGYTINGSAGYHMLALTGGQITTNFTGTITLTGTPAFSSAFAGASSLSLISAGGNTYSGAATGTRYTVNSNSVIDSNGGGASYFPGNAAGSAATGGQYL